MPKKILLSFFVTQLSVQTIVAQTIAGICPWDNCKKAAVVLTFDDWSPGIFPVATPELKSRSIPGTFFMVTRNIASWNHSWPDVQTVLGNGNEIANHTYSHPQLTILNSQYSQPTSYPDIASQLKAEIRDAKTTLEQNLPSTRILTFAYPQGLYNSQVLDSVKKTGHICARGVLPPSGSFYTYNFASTPDDYYNLRTFSMSTSVSLNAFAAEIQKVTQGGGLLTFLYHSLDNGSTFGDNWFNQVQQSVFQKQLDTLVKNQKKVWITTLVQAISYHKQFKSATLNQISPPSAGQWLLELTDTLSDNLIYKQPMSIRLKMNGIPYQSVGQNNVPIKIDSIFNDTIQFKAVPDAGTIKLSAVMTDMDDISLATNEYVLIPNPTHGLLQFQTSMHIKKSTVFIADITGKVVLQHPVLEENDVTVDLNSLEKGVYIVKVLHSEGATSQKVLVQ